MLFPLAMRTDAAKGSLVLGKVVEPEIRFTRNSIPFIFSLEIMELSSELQETVELIGAFVLF